MNHLANPGFRNLDNWTVYGGARHAPAAGNAQLGAASLPVAGAGISQVMVIPDRPAWSVWAAFYSAVAGNVAVTIYNNEMTAIYSATVALDGDGDWDQWTATIGLPPGTVTLRFDYVDAAVMVDDVSLAYIPKSRYQLAMLAHAECQELTGDIGTFAPPLSPDGEGSYAAAIDAALYFAQAINDQGQPDVRWLEPEMVDGVVAKVVEEVLTGPVLAYYQKKIDVTLGPRRENYSQIASGIRQRYGLVPGATHQGQRRFMEIDMRHG